MVLVFIILPFSHFNLSHVYEPSRLQTLDLLSVVQLHCRHVLPQYVGTQECVLSVRWCSPQRRLGEDLVGWGKDREVPVHLIELYFEGEIGEESGELGEA